MVKLITIFYSLITSSLIYYKYILKGLFVYNFLPANIALLATVKSIWEGTDEVTISQLFKENMEKYRHSKLQSFTMSFPLIVIYLSIFILESSYTNNASLILLFILLYIFIMHIVVITIYCYIALVKKSEFIKTISLAIYLSLRKLWVSISIIVLIAVFYNLADYNLFLFLFIAPFSYALLLNMLLGRTNIQSLYYIQ
jgi:uncharacterized membrane protein YesL